MTTVNDYIRQARAVAGARIEAARQRVCELEMLAGQIAIQLESAKRDLDACAGALKDLDATEDSMLAENPLALDQ